MKSPAAKFSQSPSRTESVFSFRKFSTILILMFLTGGLPALDDADKAILNQILSAKTDTERRTVYKTHQKIITEDWLEQFISESFSQARQGGTDIDKSLTTLHSIEMFSQANQLNGSMASTQVQLGRVYMYFKSDNESAKAYFISCRNGYKKTGNVNGEANCIKSLGNITLYTSDSAGAEKLYREAIPMYKKVGDVLGEANCIQSLGDIALRTSDNAGAEKLYREAIPMYKKVGDIRGEANCMRSLGNIALYTSDNAGAEKLYCEAIPMYKKAGDVLGEANCIKSLGDIALRTSDNAAAEKSYRNAIPMYKKVGDVLGEANCIQSLGDIALRTSDYAAAEKSYRDALPLYSKIRNVPGEANCIQRLGDIALITGEFAGAEKRYREALPLYKKISDILGEANCIQRLGDIALRTSDYLEAERMYRETVPLYKKVGSVLGEANSIRNLGNIAMLSDDSKTAFAEYRNSMALYQQINDRFSKFDAAIFLSRAGIRVGKTEEAKTHLQLGLDTSLLVREKAGTSSDKLRYQESIGGLMKTSISDMGNQDKNFALQIWEGFRGRSFLEGLSKDLAMENAGISEAERSTHASKKAVEDRILAELQKLSERRAQIVTKVNYTEDVEKKESEKDLSELDTKIQKKQDEQRNAEKDLENYEDSLAEKNSKYRDLRRPVLPPVPELQKSLNSDEAALVFLDSQFYYTKKEEIGGPAVWIVEKDRLEFRRLDYSNSRKKHPDLNSLVSEFRKLASKNKKLDEEKSALSILEKKLSEILLEKPLSLLRPSVKKLILVPDGAIGSLPLDSLPYKDGLLSSHYTVSYSPSLSILHLLRSRERDYSSLNRVPVLAFGGAHYRESFSKEKEDEKKETLAFLDTAEREARLKDHFKRGFREGEMSDLPGAREEVKSIGKIYYKDSKQSDAAVFLGAWTSEPVIKALNEPSNQVSSNKSGWKDLSLSSVRILHFSVHGKAEADFPETSRIILSRPERIPEKDREDLKKKFPKFQNEDGSLLAAEIVGLNLKSDLVVLSACETGLGKSSSTEGIIGLTQSWMVAGSNGVIVSLWEVSDIGTRVFMTYLHSFLAEGNDPKTAISKTREIVRKNEWRQGEFAPDKTYKESYNTVKFKDLDLSSGFYWSAFQYWGK